MPTTLNAAAAPSLMASNYPAAMMARAGALRGWQAHDDEMVDGTPRRHWAVFIALLLPLALGLAVMLFCSALPAPARLPDSEAAEIYAGVIGQLVTAGDTYPGPLRPPKIYLVTHAKTPIPHSVRKKLADAIPYASVIWVDHVDNLIDARDGTMRGGGVLIVLDDIIGVTANAVSTTGDLRVAFEAGTGVHYDFEKVHGHWLLRHRRMLWIS